MFDINVHGENIKVDNRGFLEDLDNMDKLAKFLPENPVCVDCGANRGNHTIYYSKILKAKKVYAFEPIEKIYKELLNNVAANNINNVEIYNFGLGAKESVIKLYSEIPDSRGAFAFWYEGETTMKPFDMGYKKHIDADYITAKSVSLDSIITEHVDFIKIDVEGMEMELLKGAKRIIEESNPVILIEVWGSNKPIKKEFNKWCQENNYVKISEVDGENFLIGKGYGDING